MTSPADIPVIANHHNVPATERTSPKGRYRLTRQFLSQALGIAADQNTSAGGHPFEVERATLPPGAENFPLHAHAAQWEFYWIESGAGQHWGEHFTKPLVAGDFFICPPDQPHALKNIGATPLVYWVFANNPSADLIHYPRSQKWMIKPDREVFRVPVDYYDGEE
jgi:uncharacterized cupin superfamily protein